MQPLNAGKAPENGRGETAAAEGEGSIITGSEASGKVPVAEASSVPSLITFRARSPMRLLCCPLSQARSVVHLMSCCHSTILEWLFFLHSPVWWKVTSLIRFWGRVLHFTCSKACGVKSFE